MCCPLYLFAFIRQKTTIYLCDDIVHNVKSCLKQMIEIYNEYKTSILGVQKVADDDVSKYGIVEGKHVEGRVYKVKGLVEKPSIEDAP